jgi:hypothetical protein
MRMFGRVATPILVQLRVPHISIAKIDVKIMLKSTLSGLRTLRTSQHLRHPL